MNLWEEMFDDAGIRLDVRFYTSPYCTSVLTRMGCIRTELYGLCLAPQLVVNFKQLFRDEDCHAHAKEIGAFVPAGSERDHAMVASPMHFSSMMGASHRQ